MNGISSGPMEERQRRLWKILFCSCRLCLLVVVQRETLWPLSVPMEKTILLLWWKWPNSRWRDQVCRIRPWSSCASDEGALIDRERPSPREGESACLERRFWELWTTLQKATITPPEDVNWKCVDVKWMTWAVNVNGNRTIFRKMQRFSLEHQQRMNWSTG